MRYFRSGLANSIVRRDVGVTELNRLNYIFRRAEDARSVCIMSLKLNVDTNLLSGVERMRIL